MPTEDQARAESKVHSSLTLIEAAAGCGKTHDAATYAIEASKTLEAKQEVLLLAHTNAAVQEFRRRIAHEKARVRTTTIDSFCLELVKPYAIPLNLPFPLVVGPYETVKHSDIPPKLKELWTRCPSMLALVAQHYPVIVFDEHQDVSHVQNELLDLLYSTRKVEIRVYGDPMQAIFDDNKPSKQKETEQLQLSFFGNKEHLNSTEIWQNIKNKSNDVLQFKTPHRWAKNEELGKWIIKAREELKNNRPLPLSIKPPCVNVHFISNLEDINPNNERAPQYLSRHLNQYLDQKKVGTVALLVPYNKAASGIRSITRGRLSINEGVQFENAHNALRRAQDYIGKPRDLSLSLINLLKAVSKGLNANLYAQIERSLADDKIHYGNKTTIKPLLQCLEDIYSEPSLMNWCRIIKLINKNPPPWLKIDYPAELRLLGSLSPVDADPLGQLESAIFSWKLAAPKPNKMISTVHKAKGLEYDHVAIVHCSQTPFPDSNLGRKLLYVALSRAQKSLTIYASEKSPSPLIIE